MVQGFYLGDPHPGRMCSEEEQGAKVMPQAKGVAPIGITTVPSTETKSLPDSGGPKAQRPWAPAWASTPAYA